MKFMYWFGFNDSTAIIETMRVGRDDNAVVQKRRDAHLCFRTSSLRAFALAPANSATCSSTFIMLSLMCHDYVEKKTLSFYNATFVSHGVPYHKYQQNDKTNLKFRTQTLAPSLRKTKVGIALML